VSLGQTKFPVGRGRWPPISTWISIGLEIVSWSRKKQPTISLSSIEVEYKALCSATCEAIWLRCILEDTGKRKRIPRSIKCENQS